MLSVMDRAWNQFSFTDIFDVGHGFYNKKPPMHTDGNLPFIGASGMNNGVTGFTTVDDVRRCSKIGYGSNEPIEKKLFDSGTLCVVNNGKPGYAYYQPHVYTCTHDVNPLKLKSGTMSEALGLFLAQAIKAQGVCFEYARKWRPSRMVRSKLMLPVNDGGEPDWQFMEDYVREREDAQLERCRDFLKRRLAEIERERERVGAPLPSLNEKTWACFDAFEQNGLFDIKASGSSIDAVRLLKGEPQTYPYVTRSDASNGVARFVSEKNKAFGFDKAGSITVGLDTQTAFLQPHDFVTGQNVQIVSGKHLNEMVAMFLLPILKSQMSVKFNWGGNGATLGRMKKLQLMLPVDENNEPDWAYMEAYARELTRTLIMHELDYLDAHVA